MPDLDTAFTTVVWAAVAILTTVVVVDLGRGWWEERKHARRMAAPRFSKGSNTPTQVTIDTPPPFAAPVVVGQPYRLADPTGPKSAEWWRTAIGANAAEQAEFEHLGIEAAQMGLMPDQARSLFVKWARGEIDA